MEQQPMVKRTRKAVAVVVVLVLAAVGGCGGDDDDDKAEKPVDGTFVGKVSGTDALVAVVAAPAERGRDRRDVTLYVSDGRRLSESFSGSAQRNGFVATSDDATAKGELDDTSATGSVELPDGKTVRFVARRATAAAGLYDLKVSSDGRLSGASAAGVGLTSRARLRAPGTGRLKLADGRRRRFRIRAGTGGDPVRLRGGDVRLIVLPDGEMTGGGEARPTGGGEALTFFIGS